MKVKRIYDNIKEDYGANLLRARGIEDVDKFISPDESALQDWGDLEHIDDGLQLIFMMRPNARIGLVVD